MKNPFCFVAWLATFVDAYEVEKLIFCKFTSLVQPSFVYVTLPVLGLHACMN